MSTAFGSWQEDVRQGDYAIMRRGLEWGVAKIADLARDEPCQLHCVSWTDAVETLHRLDKPQ